MYYNIVVLRYVYSEVMSILSLIRLWGEITLEPTNDVEREIMFFFQIKTFDVDLLCKTIFDFYVIQKNVSTCNT